MIRLNLFIALFASCTLIAACGDDASSSRSPTSFSPPPVSTPPPPSKARIAIAISPNPVIAELATDSEFLFRYEFTVTVSETGGVGGNVNFINETVTISTSGGQLSPLNRGAGDVIRSAGTNHVKPGSKLVVPLGTLLTVRGIGEVMSNIDLDFKDDLGNAMTASADFTIRLPMVARQDGAMPHQVLDALAIDDAVSR